MELSKPVKLLFRKREQQQRDGSILCFSRRSVLTGLFGKHACGHHRYCGKWLHYECDCPLEPGTTGRNYLDNVVPETLAPNTITVIGFLFVMVPHFYVMALEVCGIDQGQWIYLVYGVSILLYIVATLDSRSATTRMATKPARSATRHV